jgi:hypothetical protein
VANFYNRYSSDISEDLKKKMQKGVPLEIASIDIDSQKVDCKPNLQLWIDSVQQNPSPNDYYTVQVSSFEDLKQRMTESRNQASKVNERVKAEIASLKKYKKACDEDL